MDPSNLDSFNHKTEKLSTGRSYHFVDQKPDGYDAKETPTLLLLHGFPDLWYGWRHQIGPFVKAGYRVVAPDMLGYGGSDMPKETEEYTLKKQSADLAALLDLIEVSKAVVIGHDWGSDVAGRLTLWHPERVIASVLLSVAMAPAPPVFKTAQELVDLFPSFGYRLYFEDESSTKEIDSHLPTFYNITVCRAGANQLFNKPEIVRSHIIGEKPLDRGGCLLTDEEMDYYMSQTKSMHGALSYYRASIFSFEEEKAANLKIAISPNIPVLFIRGSRDFSSPPEFANRMRLVVPHLKVVSLNAGHWLMMEAKDSVTHEILAWLRGLDARSKL